MKKKLKLIYIFAIVFIIQISTAYATSPIRSWATDMYNQPSIKSFEEGNIISFPVGSVTTSGIMIKSDGFKNNYGDNLPWSDFSPNGFRYASSLTPKNPEPKTAVSISNGKQNYLTFCAACHGVSGMSENNLSKLRAVPVIRNLIPLFSEGYIYMRITYGGPILTSMPPHGYILTEKERWDIVNFIKQEFKD